MSVTITAKFSKVDDYNNPVFSVSKSDTESYQKLVTIYNKLKRMKLDTFLPVYHDQENEYGTIRFKRAKSGTFTAGSTYEIEFAVNKREHEGKTYVSCYIQKLDLLKAVDLGQTIDFTF